MLAELRKAVRDDLAAGDVKAFDYLGEALTPPCAVVVPAEPYLRTPKGAPGEPVPFRKVLAGIDVLLLVPRGEAKAEAAAMDQLVESAYVALKQNHEIGAVSRPGVVTVSGSKFVGSVLSIEALAEEP